MCMHDQDDGIGPPIDPGTQVPWGTNVSEGEHTFCLRIDPSLDGGKYSFIDEDSISMPMDGNNPHGAGYTTTKRTPTASTPSTAAPNRVHKVTNLFSISRTSGHPVAYAIHSPVRQALLAHPSSFHAHRAKSATHTPSG
ncbi:Copper amine oxidase [Macrophomina phaseolina MS6]|uniref:Copper amine oxidase n=1 Tax=Macrophomina phaseolina (strain MS6) TaxID=1126212 RepID=K2RZY6_MACPH|nr:Copper amine oxidase [Macrophomina phaseolina MS6]